MVNLCILAVISIVIGVGGILSVTLVYSLTGRAVPLDYGVVVDAGSTHSEIILYKWDGDKENGTGEVKQQGSCYVGGGLALNTDPRQAAESLENCLKTVSGSLPDGQESKTPIFLGATAGFRLLNETNSTLSDAILEEVNKTFEDFGFSPEQVRILTGQEEGLYAWITANFLTRSLTGPEPRSTMGAMDLGGASTQIAFSINDQEETSLLLRLFGSDYNVSSTSSLCYGVEESYRRHLAQLALTGERSGINEPCAPVNYTFERTAQDLFDQPCTKGIRSADHQLQETIYKFIGTGNFSSCKQWVDELMNYTTCQKTYGSQHCFQTVNAPTTEKFFAFSSFFYTASFLNATGKPLKIFQNASKEICGKSWEEVKEMPSSSNNTLPRYCFQAVLIENMLTDKYSFNESTWKNIDFVKKVNHTDVGWSLGYMINATNLIPAELPAGPSISLVAMILVVVICLGLLAVGAFLIWKQRTMSSEVSYIQV